MLSKTQLLLSLFLSIRSMCVYVCVCWVVDLGFVFLVHRGFLLVCEIGNRKIGMLPGGIGLLEKTLQLQLGRLRSGGQICGGFS